MRFSVPSIMQAGRWKTAEMVGRYTSVAVAQNGQTLRAYVTQSNHGTPPPRTSTTSARP